jgi:hypothetical protein
MEMRYNGDLATTLPPLIITVPVSSGGGVFDAEVDFEFPEFTTVDEYNQNYIQIFITGGNIYAGSYQAAGSYMDIECVSINEYSTYQNYNTQPSSQFSHSYITPSQMLPDITQADYVKNYCQMFGLLIVYNSLNNEVRFIRMDKILANIGSALDWSGKIDLIEDAEIIFGNDYYAQKNLYKYSEPNDGSNNGVIPIGTTGNLQIANENLESEKEILTLDYSWTQHAENRLLDINHIPIITAANSSDYLEADARILFLEKKTSAELDPVGGLTYNDGVESEAVTTDIPLTWFIQLLKEKNLGFGDNLLAENYQFINGIISNSKTLTLNLRLTASDINQLDFTIPVFLSQYESYFYINKIQGYAPGANESTIVELVKLNL